MKKFALLMASILTLLVIHCTATPAGREVSSKDIRDWHLKGRGWHQVGYSDMIHLDGKVENLVKYDENQYVDQWEITNGVAGINHKSRHVVYVGGTTRSGAAKDTRTDQQKSALHQYVLKMIKLHPAILISGHNQFAKKACPSFDVPEWLRTCGIPERYIYKS